jgi:ABC-type uncharacterized transport system auxiliary subunit
MKTRTLTIAFFALLMTGCAGKVRYPNYYTLAMAPSKDVPINSVPANDSRQARTLSVRRFETPAYLRQGRIVYRPAPEQIGFYDYHRWASDPGQVITSAVIDSLRSTGLFSSVASYDGQDHADYLLRGRLERLNEVDYNNSIQVEVTLSAELANTRTGASVWSGSVTKTANVTARNIGSVVTAMSRASQDCVSQLVADMEQRVRQSTVATGGPGTAEAGMNH